MNGPDSLGRGAAGASPPRSKAWFTSRGLLAVFVVVVGFLATGMGLASHIGVGSGSGAGDYPFSVLHLAELIALGSMAFGLLIGMVSYPLFIFGRKRTSDRAAVVLKASYRFIFGVGTALIGTLSFEQLTKP